MNHPEIAAGCVEEAQQALGANAIGVQTNVADLAQVERLRDRVVDVDDIVMNRPALSRWHPDFEAEFTEYMRNV